MIPAAISLYSFVLFLHIAAAVIAFGALFAAPVLLGSAGRDPHVHHGLRSSGRAWSTRRAPWSSPPGSISPSTGRTSSATLDRQHAADPDHRHGPRRRLPHSPHAPARGRGRRRPTLMQLQRAVLVADLLVLVALFLMVTKPGA